jgi:hypothetical protein
MNNAPASTVPGGAQPEQRFLLARRSGDEYELAALDFDAVSEHRASW